jgi:hypothetical protein
MLTSLLAGWFARPVDCAAPRAPRPSAATVQVEVSRTADGMVIRVKGEARAVRAKPGPSAPAHY